MPKILTELNNKRVLLTGHTGFKGSWLTLLLNELGANVVGLSLEPDSNSLFLQANVMSHCDSRIVDIRSFESVKKHIEEINPDVIFHLAAQPFVKDSYRDPIKTFETNVNGTVHILEAIRQLSEDKKLTNLLSTLVITTDKVYLNKEWDWGYREIDPLGGTDPYSCSKACTELIVKTYQILIDTPIDTARAGNVIGGGDWGIDRIIPDFIKCIINNQTLELRSPYSVRPWQHVLDPLWGYILLTQRMINGGKKIQDSIGWNFGPSDSHFKNVESLVKRLNESLSTKKTVSYKVIKPNEKHKETNLLTLNSSKSQRHLNWKCKWDFNESIQKTAEWYDVFFNNGNLYNVCTEQINSYLNSVET